MNTAKPFSQSAAKDLANELEKSIEGEVGFDPGTRALYSTDASNYRQIPIGVVCPRSADDIVKTVQLAKEFGAPILSRGGGTSLAGQCCNVAVVMDMSRYYNCLLEINPDKRIARLQPGLVLDRLRDAAEKHHLTFGPDPSTHNHCTLGGMIGNNSCGVHSVMAGRTADNVEELEILTYEGLRLRVGRTPDEQLKKLIQEGGRRGEIYAGLKVIRDQYGDLIRQRYPKIPRRVSGYNLDELLPENEFNVARALVGTESTCVTVLEAVVRLVPSPPCRTLVVLGYPDVYAAGSHIPEIMEFGPVGLEGIDHLLISYLERKGVHTRSLDMLPEGEGWLLVEFGGESKKEADEKAHKMCDELGKRPHSPAVKIYDDPKKEKLIWEVRESGLGATARVPGEKDTWPGWEDSAVPPDKVGYYLTELRKLLEKFNYRCALYGHFGQGCIHTRIDFDLKTPAGVKAYRAFIEQAADLVLSCGGSLSGEHGDGQSRAVLLPKMFGSELVGAFQKFKKLWDPDGKMNPGKVVDAYSPEENLRLGPDSSFRQVHTEFRYPQDRNDFVYANQRCVGVGKCRRTEGGTMCPSYKVTREEKHSTRGRARLLFEMLRGDVLKKGWKDPHVHQALDLCLSCKGCKGDCPVSVDMATYKAEFLYHFYRWKIRPRSAYSMGFIYKWVKWGARMPRLANFFTQTNGVKRVSKWIGGIAASREIPPLAKVPFRKWFESQYTPRGGNGSVILWPDTFNNYFHPQIAQAAVEFLDRSGYRVILPPKNLCCGRPLYDFGMLSPAKRLLRRVLNQLSDSIQNNIPLIGLEPSCLAVFRDELTNFFPESELARRLSNQSYLFSEFLQKKEISIPKQSGKALVHAHCHHRAVMGLSAEQDILNKTGLDYNLLDSGCCGMAGSFGFEHDHDVISRQIGEEVLFPAVRNADSETVILSNGFSCREQIRQGTGRRALHLAEVLMKG